MQYYRDELALDNNKTIISIFPADNNNSFSFKLKEKNNRGNWKQWHKRC